jgi:mono/diheme cytochrome c family protein
MRSSVVLTLLCAVPLACLSQTRTSPEQNPQVRDPIEGGRIFQYYCAACHGADGRGHGPKSISLKHDAPDLTLIAQRNQGKFPYQAVRNVIEGIPLLTRSHGARQMPVWGPIFHTVEADQDWGEVRLDAVTRHIESMQQK